eukprot:gene5634-gene6222
MLRLLRDGLQLAQDGFDVVEELGEDLLGLNGLGHRVGRVVHHRVVLVQHEAEANLTRRVVLQGAADGDEVLQALGHFGAVDVQVARVQPVVDPLLRVQERLRLGDLVFVVRKLQIDTAGMYIDAIEGVALDVPAGTTLAPGTVPGRLLHLFVLVLVAALLALGLHRIAGLLPQNEIRRCPLLIGSSQRAFALGEQFQVANLLWHQFTVGVARSLKLLHRKVNGAGSFIGDALVDQDLNEGHDLRDVFGDARHHVGQLHAQGLHVLQKLVLIFGSQGSELHVGFSTANDDLVVDVGHVLAQGDLVAEVVRHNAADDVQANVSTGMTHVRLCIDSRAALIPIDFLSVNRNETGLRAGQSVQDHHGV